MKATLVMAGLLLAAPVAAQVVKQGSMPEKPAPAANFTGAVRLRMLTSATAPGQAGTSLVSFPKGARSNWHTHPAGQTLYVTSGCGWTQEEGGPVQRICQGDTIYAKPGVKHWHGATDTTAMSHLAISESFDGKNVTWLEPVTAAQYHGPAR